MSTQPRPELSPLDRAFEAAGGVAALAAAVGVTASAPSMWKARGSVPVDHCAAIEAATNGAVMRWDLRPADWHRVWPELVMRRGAPTPSKAEA